MGSNPSLSDEDDDTTKFDSSVHQAPVLSMEPISMKRKKKGGGYNLRKSLAWDRAFLTEEGILDPVELSVISGTCINPAGQALSVITEVGSNFKRGDSQNIISSPSSRSHQRKKASQKMSTSHCVSDSGAKSSGCPRPPPTSSLKRHAFVNTSRSSAKELKFSKTAIPKTSMCSIIKSAKSSVSVGSQLQHNQFVQSAANNQTCASSSKIPTMKNTSQDKADSVATTSTKSLKENSTQATTALPLHPSTKVCQPSVSKVSNTFSKKTPRVDTLGISQTNVDGSIVIAPVPRGTTAGKSMHHTQFQAKKPSGLRMPSPSLGFFGQPTLMSFKPNVPGLSDLHDHRKTKFLHETKSSSSIMPLRSTTENSALSDSDGVSSETSGSVLEKNANNFVHAEFSYDEFPMHGAYAIDKLNKAYAQNETRKQIILKGDSECETSESVLKQNMNKLEHAENSYDELPVDVSDMVHAQHATSESIILKGESEHKINDTLFPLKPEDGVSLLESDDMEKHVQGFQDCRRDDGDSTCSPSMCWIGFTGDSEHNINDTGSLPPPEDGKSFSEADDMEKSIEGFLDCRSNDSEHKINNTGLLPQPEDGESLLEADDMEKSIQGFQVCRSNDSDSACFPSMCFVGVTGDSEHKINYGESLSQADDMEKSVQGFQDRESNDNERKINNTGSLPQPEDIEGLLEAGDMGKSTQGFQDCRRKNSDSACSLTISLVAHTGDSEHKINDTGLLAQPEDGESLSQADDMEKSTRGFQDCRSNDSDSTCPALTEGEMISNSAVISLSFTCELTLPAEVVPDNKSSTGNHHGLPTESCHQSLDQSDVTNYSAPEVPDCDKKISSYEMPEHNTCRCIEVLAISGEMKCQAPESCDNELESSCHLSKGKYKDRSTDTDSRTEVDDETYPGEGQSHASCHFKEYPEKHLETERIHNAVEGSSHCNLGLCATDDLPPDMEPRQEKIVEVPSSTAPEESDKRRESTSCTKHVSLQGQMARENLRRSHQHNFDGLKNNFLEDGVIKVDISAAEESTHNSCSISIEKIKNSEKDLNKNDMKIILPKDLVPFSEEWLAAIEAAGEDVLTLKTGAVQNSPPDKSLSEPSPWSPVKRKINQLGPFDCTKYTNPVPSDSH